MSLNEKSCGEVGDLDELVPLDRVPRLLPTRPHLSTIYRWAQRGCYGVKLKVVSLGKTRCTTRAWLSDFFERTEQRRATEDECGVDAQVSGGRKVRRTHTRPGLTKRSEAVLRQFGLDHRRDDRGSSGSDGHPS